MITALYCQRAKVKENAHNYTEAIEDYKNALRVDEQLYNAAYNIAVCLQKLDQQEESLEWYSVALNKDIGSTHLCTLLGLKLQIPQ